MIINVYPALTAPTHHRSGRLWSTRAGQDPYRNHLEHTISGIPTHRRSTQTGLPTTTNNLT